MPFDLGYQTKEQIEERKALYESFVKDGGRVGCIGERVCESCHHLISDTCMCIGVFTCPNCGFKNGAAIAKLIDEARKKTSPAWQQEIFVGKERL